MAAGVLRRAGYFMGECLNRPNETNPKGQFEDREVNTINEELLSRVTPQRPPGLLGKTFFRSRPTFGQRWLSQIPLKVSVSCPPDLEGRIRPLMKRTPFCFKDPRFSYTLSAWRPFLEDVTLLCIFRDPGAVVASILKQKRMVSHLRHFSINERSAFKVWECVYSHILRKHYSAGGDWLFLHYEQFLNGLAYDRLEQVLGVTVDRNFVDRKLNRSIRKERIPSSILVLYKELCGLAGYEPDSGTGDIGAFKS